VKTCSYWNIARAKALQGFGSSCREDVQLLERGTGNPDRSNRSSCREDVQLLELVAGQVDIDLVVKLP
jgi:hypothetical protein